MQVNFKGVREKDFQQLLGQSLEFHPAENRACFKNVDFHLVAYHPSMLLRQCCSFFIIS